MSGLGLFGKTAIPALRRVMDLSAWKQRAHASNLANANVPEYRRRDVRFTDELRRAEGHVLRLATTDSAHTGSLKSKGHAVEIYEETGGSEAIDTEKEMVSLGENQLRFNLAARLAALRIQSIRTSIRGR